MGAPPVGDRETGADSRRCASRDAPNRSERTAAARPAPRSFTTGRPQGDICARSRDSQVRMPTNDADLVARARAGDADAYAALLRRHQPALARVGARMLGDPVAAADVAQDAALVGWLQLDRLREAERFGGGLGGGGGGWGRAARGGGGGRGPRGAGGGGRARAPPPPPRAPPPPAPPTAATTRSSARSPASGP